MNFKTFLKFTKIRTKNFNGHFRFLVGALISETFEPTSAGEHRSCELC